MKVVFTGSDKKSIDEITLRMNTEGE
jgi:hypothetical protein